MASSSSLRKGGVEDEQPSRRSKRQKGEQYKVSSESNNNVYLQPSAAQMRQLYDYDNACAHQFMRVPLRVCTSKELPEVPAGIALSIKRMDDLLQEIHDIWQKCSVIFEIFYEPEHPDLGYRLRVAEKLPMKLNIKVNDAIAVGWKVVCSDNGPSSHLYLRSPMDHSQYLGGPISYSNWSLKSTVSVRQLHHGPWVHVVRAEIKNKLPGTELVWDYGDKSWDAHDCAWFKPECCSINTSAMKPPTRLLQSEIFQERCVLCGLTYRSMHKNATARNAQKKVHFINFHTNYLGSDWDGYGKYNPDDYPVSVNAAQLEAERLNRLLSRLNKSHWHCVPACVVLDKQELSLGTEEALKRFKEACNHLRRLGIVVLRGRRYATVFEDLSPVSCMSWSLLLPSVKKTYAMSKEQAFLHKEDLQNWETQDSLMVLQVDPNPLPTQSKDSMLV